MPISQRYNPRAKKMYNYTWSEDTIIVPTPARVLHRIAFQQASKEVVAILADDKRLSEWQQRFKAQTKYRFFRPYMVSILLAEYKQQFRKELAEHGTINGHPLSQLLNS